MSMYPYLSFKRGEGWVYEDPPKIYYTMEGVPYYIELRKPEPGELAAYIRVPQTVSWWGKWLALNESEMIQGLYRVRDNIQDGVQYAVLIPVDP